jgi:SAM-dependent methyltransferase
MKETRPGKEVEWADSIENGLYPSGAWFRREKFANLTRDINFKGKRVLDCGCGTGIIGKQIKDRGGDVIGIDISEELLKIASERIEVKQADGTDLPFEDGIFDFVVSSMVLMNIDDLDKAISEINRVLKPGGTLILAISNPHIGKRDPKTGMVVLDNLDYHNKEKRVWVFNLKDGSRFENSYIHRPLDCYMGKLLRFFTLKRLVEPRLPDELIRDKRYAFNEHLFMELVKN